MAEYITKSQVRDIMAAHYPYATLREETAMHHINEDIKALPAADVVEVVRCRECIYNRKGEYPDVAVDCEKDHDFARWLSPDFYCADGRRKDGADNG